MQHFSVHGDDAGEGDLASERGGDAVEDTCNLSFCDSLLHCHSHGCGVHFVANGSSAVEFGYFFCALDVAKGDNGINEGLTGSSALLVGMNSTQIHELNHHVVAIGWEEMELSSLRFGLCEDFLQRAHWSCVGNAGFGCHVSNRGHGSRPDDVINVDVVADECFFSAFAVDDKCKSIAVLPGEIEERTILTKLIGVVGEVARTIVIPKEHDDSAAYQLAQTAAALRVCGC